MTELISVIRKNIGWSLPKIGWNDIVEIIILAVIIYYIMKWVKKNRAWQLIRGLAVLVVFTLLAEVLQLTTISWLLEHLFSIGLVAIVVIFQPEFRKALEQIGRGNWNIALALFGSDNAKKEETFSDMTVGAIVQATFEMSKAKTGALIVLEQEDPLDEVAATGIALDSLVSSELLIQIFEHNTPLHDGAVIIRKNRIIAATCYLPLSNNKSINKELGTRHRAGVGISEETDSMTIIVSEETGVVSLAVGGELIRDLDSDSLRSKLFMMQNKPIDVGRFRLWKGRQKEKNEEKDLQ